MAGEAVTTVVLRNEFYRDSYRRVSLAFLLTLIINFTLAYFLFYLYTNPPKPLYFPTSINGRITPLFPLNRPNQSEAAVLQWASTAAVAAYTYNYVNYRAELQAASEFFTPEGWDQFLRALNATNNLQAVKERRLIVSAVPTGAPVILQKGLVQTGRFAWQVRIPILVTFQNLNVFTQARYNITMLIQRVSTLNNPRGIGIAQYIAEPVTGGQTAQ